MINEKKYSKIQKILIILFILYPFNCFADYNWKKIGSSTRGDVFYLDLSTVKKVGNNVFYLELSDYLKPSEFGDLSSKVYIEVNCLNLSYRHLKDFYYQEPMGNGEPSAVFDKVGEWENIKEGSMGENVGKFVCNYK